MSLNPFIRRLEPYPLGLVSGTLPLEEVEGLRYPAEFRELLLEYGGDAVAFRRGARFRPDHRTGREDESGYLHLDLVFGAGSDSYGSADRTEYIRSTSESFSGDGVAIAAFAGGDMLVCDEDGGPVFYWMHDVPGQDTFLLFSDFPRFLQSLEPDSDVPVDTSGIDTKASWLGF